MDQWDRILHQSYWGLTRYCVAGLNDTNAILVLMRIYPHQGG